MSPRRFFVRHSFFAFLATAALVGCQVETEQGTVSLFAGSEASATLRTLGVPDGATAVSEIDESGPDGPMPEIAIRSFELSGEPTQIRSDFVQRCQAAGLGPADADLLQSDPSALCSQRSDSGVRHVFLDTRCESASCRVVVEVRSTAF